MRKISSKQVEALTDLAEQKEVIFKLFEDQIKWDCFYAHKYASHAEASKEYYDHCIELKKALNILKYILEKI